MVNIFEDKTKMPSNNSKDVVTAALTEPQTDKHADVPGLCKWDNSIRHAPMPKIGKN